MTKQTWYDVHFSLNGYYNIKANTPEEAVDIAEEILQDKILNIEDMTHTALGVEICETIESEEQEEEIQ